MIENRRTSWWERSALPAETPATALPTDVDVLIVGAGFAGRWLAYWLAKFGVRERVLVVERDRFTYGASSRNAGFLTCGQVSEMLADVDSDGLDAVVDTFERRRRGMDLVREEFPDLGIDACGSIDWDPLTSEKRDLARELNAAAGEEVYRPRTARMAGEGREVMFNRVDGALDPVALLRRLTERSTATIAFGVRAARVAGGAATLETCTDGITRAHEIRYHRAFLCTNAFTGDLWPDSEVRPGRGQIVVTSPVRTDTDRCLGYLNAGYDYFRFLGDRLLLGGGRHRHAQDENGTTALEPTREVRDYLTGVARRVTGDDDLRIEAHWAGIMGFHRGRHLGGSPRRVVDERTEVLAGFGGMGVALTPAVTREIAEELARG